MAGRGCPEAPVLGVKELVGSLVGSQGGQAEADESAASQTDPPRNAASASLCSGLHQDLSWRGEKAVGTRSGDETDPGPGEEAPPLSASSKDGAFSTYTYIDM